MVAENTVMTGILSDASLSAYWAQLDGEVFAAIEKMSEVDENWSIDNIPVILAACERLGAKMNSREVINGTRTKALLNIQDTKLVIDVMSSLKTARGMRIFRWLEQYQPVFAQEIVQAASLMNVSDDSSQIFLERVRVLNRLHLISRIFSFSRLKVTIDKLTEIRSQGALDEYRDTQQDDKDSAAKH